MGGARVEGAGGGWRVVIFCTVMLGKGGFNMGILFRYIYNGFRRFRRTADSDH
jgi:hypothetical protein